MAQFDVLEMRDTGALVVNLQSDLLDMLNTRVVVPLIPNGTTLAPAKRLNPVFTIADQDWVFATQFLASVPSSEIRASVGSLADHRDDITAALDMLYQGF